MDSKTEEYYISKVVDIVHKYRVFLMGLATSTLRGLTKEEILLIVKRAFERINADDAFWTRK